MKGVLKHLATAMRISETFKESQIIFLMNLQATMTIFMYLRASQCILNNQGHHKVSLEIHLSLTCLGEILWPHQRLGGLGPVLSLQRAQAVRDQSVEPGLHPSSHRGRGQEGPGGAGQAQWRGHQWTCGLLLHQHQQHCRSAVITKVLFWGWLHKSEIFWFLPGYFLL